MFRPCIDLHEGRVKQIVGGSLSDKPGDVTTNFVSDRPAAYYAGLYRRDELTGGHVIMLGQGNEVAAREALAAWPGGMQVGGGINASNACSWLDAGASHVIVTSWVFRDGRLDSERLKDLVKLVGPDKLVLDLSCRTRNDDYFVVTDRWQKFTELKVDATTLELLASSCSEFLIHAVDVEGLCQGIDGRLVSILKDCCPIACTYAGGARALADLETVHQLSDGRVDLTIGSALDIFGGSGVAYDECVAFNRRKQQDKE